MDELKLHIKALKGPILVTGASGFVGSNLFRNLLKVRTDVFAVIHQDPNWRLGEINETHLFSVDFNDYLAVKNMVAELKPETVFDCAAFGAYAHESNSALIYQTNFLAKVNFVEILQESKVSAYVHAGSSSEYGTNSCAPSELGPFLPNSDYSVSKLAISKYLSYVGKHRNFPCVNLRLYSVYGQYEDTSRLIPKLVTMALTGEYPPFVDSEVSRDFVYIDDIVNAFILSASKMNPEIYGESFNIGTGVKTTISDLAELAKKVFKLDDSAQFQTMPNRQWDTSEWFADCHKAYNTIGWKSSVNLADGLLLTAKWIETLEPEDLLHTTNLLSITKSKSITAIVACYKDNLAIPIMYQRLTSTFQKLGIDYEIIFVNDGSPDDTLQVIERISAIDLRVLGITHSRNFGSQMAFRSGMELATKDAVVLLDGDLQDPPELIEEFYKQWMDGYEIVYGSRVKRDMPRSLEFLYKGFYRIFSKFSYIDIPLDAGDFSLIDKRVMKWILDSPERDLFMRGIRAYVGFNQTGVEYIRPDRMFGNSTNNLIKNFEWAKKGIFSFSNVPLTVLTSFGLLALVTSIGLAVMSAILRVVNPEIAPKGVTTLLILILLFGSVNIFAIGLVGEYVGKIMIEVKQRPRLIRSALTRNGKTVTNIPG
jgi:nucleoside-diphosphate-sugar epimerase/glycosyltransferase involved in cell wall biosynthesis